MRSEPKRRVKFRIIFIWTGFYLALLVISLRIYQLQVLEANRLKAKAEQQYFKVQPIKYPRGTLYDRNLEELAVNRRVYSVYALPQQLEDISATVSQLSPILNIDRYTLRKKLNSEKKIVWLAQRINQEQGERVMSLKLKGIEAISEDLRFYPGANLASQTLGFMGIEGIGVEGEGKEGLEYLYDKELRGQAVSMKVMKDGRKKVMMVMKSEENYKQAGSIILTLDRTVQHIAEEALKEAVNKYNARRGCLIAVEPRTGRVLALALYPNYDLNHYSKAETEIRKNWALTDPFEPGSTFKVFVVAGGIEEGLITVNDRFDCENGIYQVGDEDVIRDMRKFNILSVREILTYSSNIGAVKIAEKLGREKLYKYIMDFGFGEKTGIDFPTESKGIVHHYKKWYPLTFRTIAFGQGISVSALQMVMALSAIANDGILMKPYLAERIVYPDGEEKVINQPTMVRRVISPETAKTLTELMMEVVSPKGTGYLAQIPGYKVAGKTGTAQKPKSNGKGYEPGKWVCSFMGFVPAEEPKLAMIVVIDEPKVDYATGGMIAAPVFQTVAKYTLTAMGTLPELSPAGSIAVIPKGKIFTRNSNGIADSLPDAGKTPDFRGMSLKSALKLTLSLGQKPVFEGSGWVIEQEPLPGSDLTGRVILRMSRDRI